VAPNASANGAPALSKLVAIVIALLVNAVPLAGVLYFDWSAINVLVLYWFENLLIACGTTLRLVVHRALTRKRGYWSKGHGLGIQVNSRRGSSRSIRCGSARSRSRRCSAPSF
jgi:hypothetical protein